MTNIPTHPLLSSLTRSIFQTDDVEGQEPAGVRGQVAVDAADHPQAAAAGGRQQGGVARPLLAGALRLSLG